jgi:protein TonB
MFDDLVISSANPVKTNKPWTVALSFAVQIGIVLVMILIPLIYTEALPKQLLTTFLVAPPPPPPPPPPPAAAIQRIVKPVARLIHNGQMTAPTVIPKKVEMIKEEELPPDVGAVGVTGGVPGGVPADRPEVFSVESLVVRVQDYRLPRRSLHLAFASAVTWRKQI